MLTVTLGLVWSGKSRISRPLSSRYWLIPSTEVIFVWATQVAANRAEKARNLISTGYHFEGCGFDESAPTRSVTVAPWALIGDRNFGSSRRMLQKRPTEPRWSA